MDIRSVRARLLKVAISGHHTFEFEQVINSYLPENHHISYFNRSGNELTFLWNEVSDYQRHGSSLPVVFDYDEGNKLARIEVLNLQTVLSELGQEIIATDVNSETQICLQVATRPGHPVSFLIWVRDIYPNKYPTHFSGDGWLLIDNEGTAVGIQAIIPQ